MITRRRTASILRRAGETWFRKPREVGGELTAAVCYLTTDNKQLSNADSSLNIGDLLHPMSDPLKLFLITERLECTAYENYKVSRVTNHASIFRFVEDTARDKFGKLITTEPTLIYPAVPLVLVPAEKQQNDNAPDRASEKISYVFQSSDVYLVKPKDRLEIGNQTLVVTSIHITPTGLLQFSATANS